jgi:hypothetical protein
MKKIFTALLLCLTMAGISQVNPKDFGAKGDGVSDDGAAFYRAFAHALSFPQYQTPEIWIPAGVYRITRPLVVGGYAIKAADLFVNNPVPRYMNTSKLNLPEFQKGTYSAALKLKGIGTVSIYADFNDSNELLPALAYQAAGDQRIPTSTCQFTAEISNIGFYAKGSIGVDGKPLARVIPPYKTNNQVGLLASYTPGLKILNCSFWGFKEGMILNNCGMLDVRNIKMDYCQRACFEIQNATGQFNNVFLYMCDKGFEIRSNQLKIDTYYTRFCPVSLHVAASNNKLISIYLESLNCGEAQLIIGDNPGEPNADASLLSGISFDMLTIVAINADKSSGIGIALKENARRMSINGGSIQSCYFKYPAHLLTKITYEGLTGTLPKDISIKKD